MKVLFAKYNRNRLPQFQTVTKIIENTSGKKIAIKESLTNEAVTHIEKIYKNYDLLKKNFDIDLVKPIKKENKVFFDIAPGISLKELLLNTIRNNNELEFRRLLLLYTNYVDNMVTKRNIIFTPCEKFKNIFGELNLNYKQDIISIPNIDLIFDNIFVLEDKFNLIDYEWIFDFEIPKDYIIWRAINQFTLQYLVYESTNNFKNILEEIIELNAFKDQENFFINYVYGKDLLNELPFSIRNETHFLNVNYKNPINKKHQIQLLFEDSNLIDQFSISPIEEQYFLFKLPNLNNCKFIKLIPLNQSCIISLNKLSILKKDSQKINIMNKITTNAVSVKDNIYYFAKKDPYLYVHILSLGNLSNLDSLEIKIKYLDIGEVALEKCVKQLEKANFIRTNNNSKIVFLGASSALEKNIEKLKEHGITPDYICDNDINKQGKHFQQYQIYSPDILFSQNIKFNVLITSSYVNEIKFQLKDYNNILIINDMSNILK